MLTPASPIRRLLVLGAGIYQLSLIRRAKALGFEVHVASRPGQYPGVGEADVVHLIDTTDVVGIVALATTLGVSGVVTSGTDAAVPALAAANEALRLRAVGVTAAQTLTAKGRFRALQAEIGLPHPRFRVVRDVDACLRWIDDLGGPAIIKPDDASGSRGVTRVDTGHEGAPAAFDRAMAESLAGAVCVETVIPGHEFGGNALLADGRLVFLALSRKHMDGVTVRGHEYPARVPATVEAAVADALCRCCRRLGYGDGPLNVDLKVDDGRVCLIEVAPRLGGNGMTDLTAPAFGYDVEGEMLASALGHAPRPYQPGPVHACGSLVVGADRDGVLGPMASVEAVRAACPYVRQIHLQRRPGDHVRAMASNADLVGYVLFDIDPGATWAVCAAAVTARLGLHVLAPQTAALQFA